MKTIPYFPFTREPFKPSMGIKLLDLAHWIEPDDQLVPQLREKDRLLREHGPITYGVLPGAEEACEELEDELRTNLLRNHPGLYSIAGKSLRVRGLETEFPCPPPHNPLAQAARLVQEDFALMSPKPPVRLEAGAVCFLSRWKLSEKLGRDNAGIHVPVPYFSAIEKQTGAFLESIQVGKPIWRSNWTMQDSDELFVPETGPARMAYTPENVLANSWLRIERQTLRRLPKTGYVVFTIRTYHHRMDAIAENPEYRELAHLTISRLPLSSAIYKGMRYFWEPLKAALAPNGPICP